MTLSTCSGERRIALESDTSLTAAPTPFTSAFSSANLLLAYDCSLPFTPAPELPEAQAPAVNVCVPRIPALAQPLSLLGLYPHFPPDSNSRLTVEAIEELCLLPSRSLGISS